MQHFSILVLFFIYSYIVNGEKIQEETDFRWASSLGDHMVLQRAPQKAMVWGFGQVAQTVNVTIDGKSTITKVYTDSLSGLGIWNVSLGPYKAGGPYNISAQSQVDGQPVSIYISDVYFGDVWLCSGQSNMQFTVPQVFNAEEEIKDADNYPMIRLFTAAEEESDTPLVDLKVVQQVWSIGSSKSVNGGTWKYFSAVCWFYGKNLYKKYKIPIGLIATDWGGTPVEAWSSPDALAKCNLTKQFKMPYLRDPMFGGPQTPSVLWNAMIVPFLKTVIKGAIWYQGEANAYRPDTYNCTFPAMISDWRDKWYKSTSITDLAFPFGFVQLAADGTSFKPIGGFPQIRWGSTADYGYVPNELMKNVFMAVAMDLGDPISPYGSVHPRDKQDVGYRLALAGMVVAYGEDLYYTGPLVSYVKLHHVVGRYRGAEVFYSNTGASGITVVSTDNVHFEILCQNSTNQIWTSTFLQPSTSSSVMTTFECPDISHYPSGIRYAWRDDPCNAKKCAVYSLKEGLPSPPFIIMFKNKQFN